jgi:transposase
MLPKKKLLQVLKLLTKSYKSLLSEKITLENRVKTLETELQLVSEANKSLEASIASEKIKKINRESNRPSSKQAEWEKKGEDLSGVGNDGQKVQLGRGKKGRKGAGNQPKKKEDEPTETVILEVKSCGKCGKDLQEIPTLSSVNSRQIVDIPAPIEKVRIIEVHQCKKYCTDCQSVNTAKTDLALPNSDIGLNTVVKVIFLWLSMSLPYTRIQSYLETFFALRISTSGLSSMVIRVSEILKPVYKEILENVRASKILQADETGWRVNGKNWWLWVFGTKEEAIYTVDKSRGQDVVRRILGEIFLGVLVVDGWSAYLFLVGEQQTCMAHVLRKIRKFHAAFPELEDVYQFYLKLRKILRDGVILQGQRPQYNTPIFENKVEELHIRLDKLLEWENPSHILAQVIKKVIRQRPRILTFVEHADVPCHNNYAEYLIRIGVLKRKVSFGSKSAEGATAYATLLSIYTTCRLRKISFAHFLKKSLQHYALKGKPLLLKEYKVIYVDQKQPETEVPFSKVA